MSLENCFRYLNDNPPLVNEQAKNSRANLCATIAAPRGTDKEFYDRCDVLISTYSFADSDTGFNAYWQEVAIAIEAVALLDPDAAAEQWLLRIRTNLGKTDLANAYFKGAAVGLFATADRFHGKQSYQDAVCAILPGFICSKLAPLGRIDASVKLEQDYEPRLGEVVKRFLLHTRGENLKRFCEVLRAHIPPDSPSRYALAPLSNLLLTQIAYGILGPLNPAEMAMAATEKFTETKIAYP